MIQRLIPRFVALLFACFFMYLPARAERLPIRAYTSADGLGSSFVSCLLPDSRGFLWACTRDGLSRFDGSRFVTYQIGDGSAPGVEQMIETRKGIYWIVTTGGLYRFDPSVSTTSSAKSDEHPTLPVRYVDSSRGFFFEDRDGNLWSGGDDLYRRYEDGQNLAAERVDLKLPRNPATDLIVFRLMQTRDGSLWLFTSWGLVRRIPDGREVFYQMGDARSNPLTGFVEDVDGRIWASRLRGLYIINPLAFEQIPTTAMTVVNLDQQERLLKPDATHVELPTTRGEIVKYPAGSGFLPDIITAVYQTADQHMWIMSGDSLVEVSGQDVQAHPHLEVTSKSASGSNRPHFLRGD
jgi:ligand-binding sensor domain-containing protein